MSWLLCHGGRSIFHRHTFVPDGRTLRFYVEFDQLGSLLTTMAATAGAELPVVNEYPRDAARIPNYQLGSFTSSELARHVANDVLPGTRQVNFLGLDGLPARVDLCSQPGVCRPPQHGADCRGLFNLLPDPDIDLVCCRVELFTYDLAERYGLLRLPAQGQANLVIGTETDSLSASVKDEADAILSSRDPRHGMERFLSLPQASRAMLLSYPALRTFVDAEWAKVAPAIAADGDTGWLDPGVFLDKTSAALKLRYGAALTRVLQEAERFTVQERVAEDVTAHFHSAAAYAWLHEDVDLSLLRTDLPRSFVAGWPRMQDIFRAWFTNRYQASPVEEHLLTLYALPALGYAVGGGPEGTFARIDVLDACQGHSSHGVNLVGQDPELDLALGALEHAMAEERELAVRFDAQDPGGNEDGSVTRDDIDDATRAAIAGVNLLTTTIAHIMDRYWILFVNDLTELSEEDIRRS